MPPITTYVLIACYREVKTEQKRNKFSGARTVKQKFCIKKTHVYNNCLKLRSRTINKILGTKRSYDESHQPYMGKARSVLAIVWSNTVSLPAGILKQGYQDQIRIYRNLGYQTLTNFEWFCQSPGLDLDS